MVVAYPETPSPLYSTRKRKMRNGQEDTTDKTNREGTKNVFLNGWTVEGQKMFNDLMMKIRDDRADYGTAFDERFLKFCQKMEEDNALQRKPKKKKSATETVHVYSEHNIPPRNTGNLTEEFKNQIKTTNEDIQKWKCDAMSPEFL